MNSSDIAEGIAAKAKEIAACMELYPRVPAVRDALVTAAALLINDISGLHAMLQRKIEIENETKDLGTAVRRKASSD